MPGYSVTGVQCGMLVLMIVLVYRFANISLKRICRD